MRLLKALADWIVSQRPPTLSGPPVAIYQRHNGAWYKYTLQHKSHEAP